jgi:hypothetical protein
MLHGAAVPWCCLLDAVGPRPPGQPWPSLLLVDVHVTLTCLPGPRGHPAYLTYLAGPLALVDVAVTVTWLLVDVHGPGQLVLVDVLGQRPT